MRHLTCPDTSETLGLNVTAFFDNLLTDAVKPIAAKHGLTDVDPHSWIRTSALLNALNDMGKQSFFDLVAVGMEIGKITPVAPGVEDPTLERVLGDWDGIYQYLHRNADVGKIACEKVDDKHFKLTFTDLYPDDFSYGIMFGYARRFLPKDTPFKVYYDPAVTPRDRGGNGPTVIHISWE